MLVKFPEFLGGFGPNEVKWLWQRDRLSLSTLTSVLAQSKVLGFGLQTGKFNGPTAQGQILSINLESPQSWQEGSSTTALLYVQTPSQIISPFEVNPRKRQCPPKCYLFHMYFPNCKP